MYYFRWLALMYLWKMHFIAPLWQAAKALVQSFWLYNHLANFRYVNSKRSLERKTTVCISVSGATSPSKKPRIFSEMAIPRWLGKDRFGLHVILQGFSAYCF